MDEELNQQQEPTIEKVNTQDSAWKGFMIPSAIIIAGMMISASILLKTKIDPSQDLQAQVGNIQQPSVSVSQIKDWAKKIDGLDMKKFAQCVDSGKYNEIVAQSDQASKRLGLRGTPSFFVNGIVIEGDYPDFSIYDSVFNGILPEIEDIKQSQAIKTDMSLNKDDHILGDPNAPITMIEFSDFQCPFCHRFFNERLPYIKKNYIDTGKAKLVYRHFFPVPSHTLAVPFANASECAAEQGKFWEMHNAIFVGQR